MLLEQLEDFNALLEADTQVDAGALQGAHELTTVVDLSVLLEEQSGLPARPDAWDFTLEASAIEGLSPGSRGINVTLRLRGEGHHDSAVPQPAGEAAVGFDLVDPAGNPPQAVLAEAQQITAEPFGMGREHPGGHKPSRFAALAAEHLNGASSPGELMGQGETHEAATEDQNSVALGGCHGRSNPNRQCFR